MLQTPLALAIGHFAVKSKTRIVTDVDSLPKLTAGSFSDADLYQTTIEWAIGGGLPTVIVFASPGFCASLG